MNNLMIISIVVAVLVYIGAFYCSGNQPPREFDRRPKPALEQFPALPYVAPPTPQARAAQAAQNESNRLARAAHRAAVASLAASLGAPTGTTAEAVMRRAAMIEALKDSGVPAPPGNHSAQYLLGFAAGAAAAAAMYKMKGKAT